MVIGVLWEIWYITNTRRERNHWSFQILFRNLLGLGLFRIAPNSSKREFANLEGCENLPKLFISPTEKMMDEFDGSVKELRVLFKIQKISIQTGSLHQQMVDTENCNSQKQLKGCYQSTQWKKVSTF